MAIEETTKLTEEQMARLRAADAQIRMERDNPKAVMTHEEVQRELERQMAEQYPIVREDGPYWVKKYGHWCISLWTDSHWEGWGNDYWQYDCEFDEIGPRIEQPEDLK